ncbi:MAG: response regulator [Novosphingobium sp.]
MPLAQKPEIARIRRILVVEDSVLVVMMIENAIVDSGWSVVGPAAQLAEAKELAAVESFDAALLDVNLGGEMSWEVAAILADRNIPFVFTTGYDAATALPQQFADRPVVGKPFAPEQIVAALGELLGY